MNAKSRTRQAVGRGREKTKTSTRTFRDKEKDKDNKAHNTTTTMMDCSEEVIPVVHFNSAPTTKARFIRPENNRLH